jgi:site-specific DNA recombinase
MVDVYQEVISRLHHNQTKGERADLRSIKQELEQVNTRLVNARNLLVEDQLDVVDYRAIKAECEKKISELEARLFASNTSDTNIEVLLRKALENLSRLDQLWEEATAEKKRLIIGSIFPEKLTFDGKRFQTTRLNEGARLIYTLNEGLSENKNGQSEEISALSCSVTRAGFKPIHKSLVCKGFQGAAINYSPNYSLTNFTSKLLKFSHFLRRIVPIDIKPSAQMQIELSC